MPTAHDSEPNASYRCVFLPLTGGGQLKTYSSILKLMIALALVVGSVTSVSSADAALDDSGQWSGLLTWPIIPIHMALTPDGNVMSYGSYANGTQGGDTLFDVWIPALGTGSAAHSVMPNGVRTDLFCSVQVIDPIRDVVMTAGGDIPGEEVQGGTNEVTSYSTSTGLQAEAAMQFARWYPTANTLPDGRILVEGGSTDGVEGDGVTIPEIYESGQGWTTLTGIDSDYAYGNDQNRWWYPRSWVAPDGRVFGISGSNMYYLNTAGSGSISQAGTFPIASATNKNIGATSTAVMYRPGKILQVGGGGYSNNDFDNLGSDKATIIDITTGLPVLSAAADLNFGRHWGTSTVLPDGDVLVTGGSTKQNEFVSPTTNLSNDAVLKRPEIWDPNTNTWTVLPGEQKHRLYHSTALLLPDATVLVAGGGAPGPESNLNGQILSPPYLFNGNQPAARPTISSAPDFISYGKTFDITVSSDVQKLTLVRMGAVTHSFNSGQRFMELPMSGSGTTRTATAPANGNVAPPGSYMLFGLNSAGTPSVAALVDINPAGTDPEPDPDPVPTLTDSQFVAASYQDVLGRNATSSERSAALATIAASGRAELVEDLLLLNTAEGQSRAAIARLYRAFFLREPDLGGFNYWYQQSVTLRYDPNPISFSFSVQPEFQNRYGNLNNNQYIDLVYTNVLGRLPDAAGRSYWLNLMNSNQLNRGQVMIWFSEGQENKNNVDGRILTVNTYRAVLNRMPTAGEIAAWQNLLNTVGGVPSGNPQSVSVLIDQLLASDEYLARIGS